MVLLGAVLAPNDLIYLILIPMLIAKNHSEKMAAHSKYQRVCYAGTIVGVVLALCQVGKYLFSDNLAAFLVYITRNASGKAWDDVITTILLIVANLIIWGPISRELRTTKMYKSCCNCKNTDADESLEINSSEQLT